MRKYELNPHNGRKSFYGKAMVELNEKGTKKLYSYDTLVLSIDADKNLHRHWDTDSPTTTTMTHIKSFIAEELGEDMGEKFNASRYRALELEDDIY